MKIFSQDRPGLISGFLMAATVLTLLTMRVKGDISLLATAGCIILTIAYWYLATIVVGHLREVNHRSQQEIENLWLRIHHNNVNPRIVPADDRRDPRRVPRAVRLFRERYPNWK